MKFEVFFNSFKVECYITFWVIWVKLDESIQRDHFFFHLQDWDWDFSKVNMIYCGVYWKIDVKFPLPLSDFLIVP